MCKQRQYLRTLQNFFCRIHLWTQSSLDNVAGYSLPAVLENASPRLAVFYYYGGGLSEAPYRRLNSAVNSDLATCCANSAVDLKGTRIVC